MNASTFSARVTISTLTDFYSAITAAIGTLKGPLHGGANEGVIHMLEEIGERRQMSMPTSRNSSRRKRKSWASDIAFIRTLDPRAPHLRAMAVKLSEKSANRNGSGCRSESRS